MKPLRILNHALWQVIGNAGQVMRIIALPLAIGAVVVTLALLQMRQVAAWGPGGPRVILLLLVLVVLLLTTWIAVNFHRMVLLGERFGWLPSLHRRETLGYVLQSLPLIVVLILVTLMLSLVGLGISRTLAVNGAPPRGLVTGLGLVMGLIVSTLGMRLLAMLPALAIGTTISGAFAAMRGSWPTLAGLAVLMQLLQLIALGVLRLVAGAMVGPGGHIGPAAGLTPLLTQLLLQGGLALVSISVLTTLYGHYVQGRPLR